VSGSVLAVSSIIGNVPTPALAAAAIAKSKQDFVQIDGLVVLKVLKHCQEMGGGAESVQGILTGMVQTQDGPNGAKRIEITNCFGLPNINNFKATNGSADFDEVCNQLITDNLKNFRHLNIDHLIVGWYQSSLFGSFVNKSFIEDHFMYQSEIEDSIVLVYDPFKTQHGSLFLKAYRLTPAMMEIQRRKDFSTDAIKEMRLNHENFMEELPVIIKNSHLLNSVLCELQEMTPAPKKYSFLDLSTSNVLEKNLRSLIENVDELGGETTKFLNYHKQLQKQNHSKQQYMQKREAENSARRSRGEPPLPEEDINKIFKPLPQQSRLESLLISNQIKNYCAQINDFTSQSYSNLFITEAVQNK
jgi:translation initiation factor 3 subunit H